MDLKDINVKRRKQIEMGKKEMIGVWRTESEIFMRGIWKKNYEVKVIENWKNLSLLLIL